MATNFSISSFGFAAVIVSFGAAVALPISAQVSVSDSVAGGTIVEQPRIDNARYQFLGAVNAAAVQVRSGPGENYYPTAKLDKGAQVTVVGVRFDWLKITPPEGSFSVVAKSLVNRVGDSAVGKIIGDNVNIRAGSSLSTVKSAVQCKLQRGDEVQIVGEEDEYYHIKPPAEAYLYVQQKLIDPVKQLAENPAVAAVKQTTPTPPPVNAIGDDEKAVNPVQASIDRVVEPTPKIDPAVIALAEFQRLEIDAKSAEGRALLDRPYPQLIDAYADLLKTQSLPTNARQIAEARLTSLNIKNRAREDYLQTMKQLEEINQRAASLREQRVQAEQRVAANAVTVYTAVGTLRASSIQGATEQGLYRITDPATGRTLCYVRSVDPKTATFVDKFVGVKGELGVDAQLGLKTVTISDIATVEPGRVNHTISAQIVPPSLIGDKDGKSPSANND